MRRLAALLVALPLLTASAPAQAKDLRNRFGMGFNNQLSHIPAVSLKYWLPAGNPSVNVAVELHGGVSVLNNAADALFLGGRLSYALVTEDNMNLYAAAGAGFVSEGEKQDVRVQPALGTEFFFFGLDNLGFMAEWGLNIDLGEDSKFEIITGPAIGLHYYF
jgi:hypothetical protein